MASACILCDVSCHWLLIPSARRVRLYSTKSLKPLGSLGYHKGSCQALTFAYLSAAITSDQANGVDSEDELDPEEHISRSRWLVSGGKDAKVAIWPLMNFDGGSSG
jgi:hypothetical protein